MEDNKEKQIEDHEFEISESKTYKFEISVSKTYHNFGTFIARKKIANAHKISKLILETFALSRNHFEWKKISFNELKKRGILPCKNYQTFHEWRNLMIESKLLICMADKNQLKSDVAIFTANRFKFGTASLKYIKDAWNENLPRKVDELDLKIAAIEKEKADNKRVNQIESDVERIESEVEMLKRNVNNLTAIVLEAFPPDTPKRRKIVEENLNDKDNCIRLLKIENRKKKIAS